MHRQSLPLSKPRVGTIPDPIPGTSEQGHSKLTWILEAIPVKERRRGQAHRSVGDNEEESQGPRGDQAVLILNSVSYN